MIATATATVASLLGVPIFVQSLSYTGQPEDPTVYGWPARLLVLAVVVGTPSMFLVQFARRAERRRGSRPGIKLANVGVWIAYTGCVLCGLPLVVAASAGL